MTTIPYTLSGGTKCLVEVIHYNNISPCNNADNPYDYYGYEDIEFAILHLDGTDWEELNYNLTDKEVADVEKVISDFFHKQSGEE